MEWAFKLIAQLLRHPATTAALISAKPFDSISAAIRCHKWYREVFDLVSAFLSPLGASYSVESDEIHKTIDLSIHLIETSKTCLISSYLFILEMLRKNDKKAREKSNWNLARLIPLISKHLPTLKRPADFKIICELIRGLASHRRRFLEISDQCDLVEIITPYLDYKQVLFGKRRRMSKPSCTSLPRSFFCSASIILPTFRRPRFDSTSSLYHPKRDCRD